MGQSNRSQKATPAGEFPRCTQFRFFHRRQAPALTERLFPTRGVVYDIRMSSAEKPRSRRFDSLAQEAFLNLWRTYDRLRIHEEELFGRYDLTPQQYNALRLLRREHPANIPTLALASRLVSRAPDITRLLDRLVERGLIERERRPENRRVVRVGITAAGLDLLKTMEAEIKRCHDRQLGHLSHDQLQQLIAMLREARRPHEPSDSTWI
jgi:DNA-binding MarR family transcriptional regulator